jgi:hypothetical protein
MTYDDSAGASLREARLRPEAADQVQWAPTGVWLPASTLAAQALCHATDVDPRARALGDHAFEFRGGRPEAARRTSAPAGPITRARPTAAAGESPSSPEAESAPARRQPAAITAG